MEKNIFNLNHANSEEVLSYIKDFEDINDIESSVISTLLFQSVLHETSDVFDYFFTHLQNIQYYFVSGEHPLLYRATQYQFTNGIKLILNTKTLSFLEIQTPFAIALKSTHISIINLYLEYFEYEPPFNFNPYIELTKTSPFEIVELLLKSKFFDPSDEKNTAYFIFNQLDRKDLCAILLSDNRVIACAFKNGQNIYSQKQLTQAMNSSPELFV